MYTSTTSFWWAVPSGLLNLCVFFMGHCSKAAMRLTRQLPGSPWRAQRGFPTGREVGRLLTTTRPLQTFRFSPWTDGAVQMEIRPGGAAMPHDNGMPVRSAKVACGPLACSYRTECEAGEAGLAFLDRYLRPPLTRNASMVVVADSLSLLMALSTGPTALRDGALRRIWTRSLALVGHGVRLPLRIVLGHCELASNQAVVMLARAAISELPATRAWMTDVVTGPRRHADVPRDRGTSANTLRRQLPGHNRPTPKNGDAHLTREQEDSHGAISYAVFCPFTPLKTCGA